MGEPVHLDEPENVLDRLQRGLAGYVSYLAACEMNNAFSEYVLYEPMLRILTARGFLVECEERCPNIQHAPTGDKKKIDFVAQKSGNKFAIEVKWPKDDDIDIERDREKLAAFKGHVPGNRSFLCVFGRQSFIRAMAFAGFQELGNGVYGRDVSFDLFDCLLGGPRGVRVATLPGLVVERSSSRGPGAPNRQFAEGVGMNPPAGAGNDLDDARHVGGNFRVPVGDDGGSGHPSLHPIAEPTAP